MSAIASLFLTVGGAAPLLAASAPGGCLGFLSMSWYGRLSPQAKIGELGQRAAEARLALARFDGSDLTAVTSLAKQALAPALRRIGLILLPTLVAALPVLGVAWWADQRLNLSQLSLAPGWHPAWLFSGHVAFWVPLMITALTVKRIRGIK